MDLYFNINFVYIKPIYYLINLRKIKKIYFIVINYYKNKIVETFVKKENIIKFF